MLCACDTGNVLPDGGTLVEISRNIIRRRADQLHTTLLFVGGRALEGRKEGMMNVDDPAGHLTAEYIRE